MFRIVSMSQLGLSSPVETLLSDTTRSYEELEVLLYLCRHPAESVTAETLAACLGLLLQDVRDAATHLYKRGALVESVRGTVRLFRYAPKEPQLARTVEDLRIAYESDPVTIIRVMSANALSRVRNDAIKTFADAFVLGSGRRGGR